MEGGIGWDCAMSRCCADTGSPMLQFLLNLEQAVGKKLGDHLFGLNPRQRSDKLAKGSNGVGLGIGSRIVIYEVQHEVEEVVRQMQADYIQGTLERFQHDFFHLATCGVSLATFFWEVLV